MKTILATVSTAALCLTLAACSSTSAVKPSAAETAPTTPAAQAAAPAQAAPVATETEAQRLAREEAALAKKSVYFDFDDYTLKSQYQDTVHQNAVFMSGHGKDNVILEGNADERGSKEYNLALGQKRAETVRKALVTMGVPDARIEAISYGAEKPRATCHEDKCWDENRRVDFTHKAN